MAIMFYLYIFVEFAELLTVCYQLSWLNTGLEPPDIAADDFLKTIEKSLVNIRK